jgi:uncharacterized membrane-anchored protein
MSSRMTTLAVLVPVLGLALLAARAEVAQRSGAVWTIPIEGHDPRDLLHGQYLRYQYRLRWHGQDTCGPVEQRLLRAGCCLCLTRDAADGFDPFVRQVDCDSVPPTCDAHLQSTAMLPPQRHFIPEDRGHDLEAGLRTHAAAIELAVSPSGEPAVRELVLDRRPWRDVLGP